MIYFNFDDVINCHIDAKHPFIIANDYIKKNNDVGRNFTIFNSFQDFLKIRDNYPHCHEILIDHCSVKPFKHGRLVFDIDIETKYNGIDYVPKNFIKYFEKLIKKIIKEKFIDVNMSILEFVWSTSQNPNKYSKHLTVKNFCFENWIIMSKIFYRFMEQEWDDDGFVFFDKVVDKQVVRKNGSLRMVGSSKIDKGYILEFDDDSFELEDSLIRIYDKEKRRNEQIITMAQIIEIPEEFVKKKQFLKKNIQSVEYDDKIIQTAFDMVNELVPDTFTTGNLNGNFLQLKRLKSHKCPFSDRVHDSDNCYLNIVEDINCYKIYFGCYRKCGITKSSKLLGKIEKNKTNKILYS